VPGLVPDGQISVMFQLFSTKWRVLGSPGGLAINAERYYGMGEASAYGFVDGRRHLKENLIFMLRAGTVTHPFNYQTDIYVNGSRAGYDGV